jgi:hypothetical protein
MISATAGDDDRVNRDTRRAIKSVRQTITELREASPDPHSALAYGFVLQMGGLPMALTISRYASPLRTA